MRIQVNSDSSVEGSEELTALVEAVVEDALSEFSDHITRVEVHLSDENKRKVGGDDKRCMIQARLEGSQPIAVHDQAGTMDQAIHGAAGKLKRLIESARGRQADH